MAKGTLRVNGVLIAEDTHELLLDSTDGTSNAGDNVLDEDGFEILLESSSTASIQASAGDNVVIREDDGTAVLVVDTNGKTTITGSGDLEVRAGAATPGKLLLTTDERTVVDGNKLGQIDFQAPFESAGTDAILVGASIHAEADATFAADNNSTELVFSTGASETATEKMRITSDGLVYIPVSSQGIQIGSDVAAYTIKRDSDGLLNFRATQANFNGYVFDTVDGERMRINSSGNVGIGTTGPLEKLDVAGNIVGTGGQDSSIECGRGTGSVAMTVNDGGGNANLTFNHRREVPDVSGNAGRIQVNVDASSGSFMSFGVKSGVTQNTQVGIPIVFTINESGVSITGSLSKSSGSFRIPHPLSSKTNTHDLVHSFIEAPQADNIYRGKVNLVNGTATVNIDTVAGMSEGTFVLLNREIQCFTSNETGWTAVKGSVSGNILTIIAQDNTCTDTISWLVIGERQDQHMYDTEWTDENGKVIVEPLKPVEEETIE